MTPIFVSNKPALKYLALAQCEIEAVLDSTFQETANLEVLILRNNNLKFMTAGQLKGLKSLTHLGNNRWKLQIRHFEIRRPLFGISAVVEMIKN